MIVLNAPATSAFDLREWLAQAEALGQLQRIDGVDPKLELGVLTDLNAKRGGPAFLFDKLVGYPAGFRVLTGSLLNGATLGLTLGFAGPLGKLEVVDRVAEILREVGSKADRYPVELVQGGPVMDNVATGEAVDLTMFPTPLWHAGDGGPYIGTGAWQIHRDPETGWINVGTYRNQLLGKNLLGNYISPGHHGSLIRQKYWDRGEPCPVVVCFGAHPLFLLMGSSDVPADVSELSWAGAVAARRVPVIEGPVTGLPIPADAEIVVEGFAYAGDQAMEGPLGEFTGYYAGGKTLEPVIHVQALYYRNNPILLGSPPCRPPDDFSYQVSVMRSAAIVESLHRAGVPGVRGVWVSEAGGGRMWIVVSITQKYAGHASQAAAVACNCQAGGLMARYCIVVDDDIDPSNNDDVIWALSTRSDPATTIDILRECWSNPLDPMIADEDKVAHRLWNSRAIVRACKPFDRLATFAPVAEASPALVAATKAKWASLFVNSL